VKRPVLWSRTALDDLIEIARFIAADNPAAARRVAAEIRRTGNLLGQAAIGRPGRVIGTYERSVRRMPYIIAYTLQTLPTGREAVLLLRVIHGARNWPDEQWPK